MKYNPDADGGGIEAHFVGDEVEAVSRAFQEGISRLRSLGNDSSVSEYQKWVALWFGKEYTYRGHSNRQLRDHLSTFVESTEEQIDELQCRAGTDEAQKRAAARRYEMGHLASGLLVEIEATADGDLEPV